jgi:enoyl reductase
MPVEAWADASPPGGSPSETQSNGTQQNGDISATAGAIRFDTSKNGSGSGVGPVTPTTNWSPPACWYAPKYTPQQLQQQYQDLLNMPEFSGKGEAATSFKHTYIDGHPYNNFNLDKQGKGYWWDSYIDPSRSADPNALSCNHPPFWVDNGQPPQVKNSVTPELLAQLAYARMKVPSTTVSLNPTGIQTVNLATWVWLDKTVIHPVSVTASVDVLNVWATTTATPMALHIDPGTQDANVYPASGDCPINTDGSIGTPYNGDVNATPPCGLTYRRSTDATGSYQLKATVTWKISWQGSGGTGGDLPNGTFATSTPVTVQEIQTVVH